MTIESNATPARDDAHTNAPPHPSPRLLKPNSEHPPTSSENIPPPSAAAAPEKEGERGEVEQAAVPAVSNADFVATLFPSFLPGARAAVCTKEGDPKDGGWTAGDANEVGRRCLASRNNYVNTSSFTQSAGEAFGVRKEHFAALHLVVLDDVGTKIDPALLGGLDPTWEIETSPGNSQVGILLREPVTDLASAERLLAAVIARGLCDPGATGVSRWGRLPVAINGKAKYRNDGNGKPFECRLLVWNPEASYSVAELVTTLGLQLRPTPIVGQPGQATIISSVRHEGDDIYTPAPRLNPVIAALKQQGRYKKDLGSGKHDITCPWVQEHTDELDTGAAYFEPTEQYAAGGFRCQHSHGDQYHVGKLLDYLGIDSQDARCKASIRLIAGDINRVNAAAEKALASRGNIYAQGGDIVTIVTDPVTGDLATLPLSDQALTKELAAVADWQRRDKATNAWVRCDPPVRNVNMLYKAQTFDHLPRLTGLVRQPFFRDPGGDLVCAPGYDSESGKFATFDGNAYVIPEPTRDAAEQALALLLDLLAEFRFATPEDKAAALSAILTAIVRPSLALAPAFHVRAPTMGSGKSYLNEVIVAFATPGQSQKVSYPTTSEEASKAMLALLRHNPAAIEFDDMSDDWKAHGIMNRMLTSDCITERLLGASKALTVSTRTLILGSGNNVGPVRDLSRRVLTIHLDPRTANPALLTYQGRPAELVRSNRAKFITAGLTIIMAWRATDCPRTPVPNIASYGDQWADHARHPLLWLGLPDPAQSLIDQVRSAPDSDALGELLLQWHLQYGERSMPIRKVLKSFADVPESPLREAIEDLPIFGREGINKGRLGWYLSKNKNRIVDGLEFREGDSMERKSWRVCKVQEASS